MKEEIGSIITLDGDDGEFQVEVIEQTVVNGATYLLVAAPSDEEIEDDDTDECMILKDVSKVGENDASYVIVEGEEEEKAFEAFEKILSEDNIEITR